MFDSGDDENVKLVKDYFVSSSLCFTQMRTLRRFCIRCQDVFLMHSVSCILSRMMSFLLLNRLNLEKCR